MKTFPVSDMHLEFHHQLGYPTERINVQAIGSHLNRKLLRPQKDLALMGVFLSLTLMRKLVCATVFKGTTCQ